MFDFKKLRVYALSKELHTTIYKSIIKSWTGERYFKDQLGRAALSVSLNIAEGNACLSSKAKRRYFVIARASLFETIALLEILKDLNQLNPAHFEKLKSECTHISILLWKFIRSLED